MTKFDQQKICVQMTIQFALAIALHQLGTIIWIGGMFFAHSALRLFARRKLDPAQRLPLVLAVFRRFFIHVWIAAALLWVSGFWIAGGIYRPDMGWHVYAMILLALLISILFFFIYLVPYRIMRKLIAVQDWPAAEVRLVLMRRLFLVNLLLGLAAVSLGSAGYLLQQK